MKFFLLTVTADLECFLHVLAVKVLSRPFGSQALPHRPFRAQDCLWGLFVFLFCSRAASVALAAQALPPWFIRAADKTQRVAEALVGILRGAMKGSLLIWVPQVVLNATRWKKKKLFRKTVQHKIIPIATVCIYIFLVSILESLSGILEDKDVVLQNI